MLIRWLLFDNSTSLNPAIDVPRIPYLNQNYNVQYEQFHSEWKYILWSPSIIPKMAYYTIQYFRYLLYNQSSGVEDKDYLWWYSYYFYHHYNNHTIDSIIVYLKLVGQNTQYAGKVTSFDQVTKENEDDAKQQNIPPRNILYYAITIIVNID